VSPRTAGSTTSILAPVRGGPRELLARAGNSRAFLSVALLLPGLAIVAFVFAYPIGRAVALSFTDYNLLEADRGVDFVGLANFGWIWRQELFWLSLRNTAILTVLVVGLELVVGLGVALLLAEAFRGVGLFRGVFILPWAIPTVVVAFLFRAYLSPRFGLLNLTVSNVQQGLGMREDNFVFDWLGSASTALLAAALVLTWKGLPFVMLVLLAGLQGIPRELGEAARIDGASAWQELRYVTLPSLKLVIQIVVVLRIISTFNGFEMVYLLTGGGPQNATRVLAVEVFNRAFVTHQIGRAAAITVVMLLFLGALSYWFLALRRQESAT
jgi:multiple sugar transport system permease protein